MIPAQAVEAIARGMWVPDELDDKWDDLHEQHKQHLRDKATRALEAAAPHMLAPLLTLADERDNVHGTIRGHITTHELRTLLNEGEKK